MKDWPIPDCPIPTYQPRTAAVVANEKWIVWLCLLSPDDRQAVFADEVWYFDEFVAQRMSLRMIIEDALDLAGELELNASY